jgi:threonine dehydrogenase-like Zn-dependent dehydrogenase
MKKAAILGERQAGLVDVPDPRPKEDWALVKIHVAPMCTEFKAFLAGSKTDCLGHEAVGEVVEIAQPGRVQVGDRVVVQPQYPCGKCHLCVSGEYIHCEHNHDAEQFLGTRHGTSTMAQYLVKPSWLLSPIPDEISYERGGLALCGLGPTFNACQLTQVGAADTVLITGLGPVGLGGVVNARFRNARVIAVDMNEWRRNRALAMGAIAAFDPTEEGVVARIRALTTRNGVDVAIDTSGATEAHRLCLESLRRKGRFSLVQGLGESPVGLGHFVWSGHSIHGAWHYNLGDYWQLMEVIRRSDLLDLLVSHILPMTRIQEAFELQLTGRSAKVMLRPWE